LKIRGEKPRNTDRDVVADAVGLAASTTAYG
jgi:hypothetical protein